MTSRLLLARPTLETARRRNVPPGALRARALSVLTSRPTARSSHSLFQLLLSPADPAFTRGRLFRVDDPADELVAGQGRDVLPGVERWRVGDQRSTQIDREVVHHATGNSRTAHDPTVANHRPWLDDGGELADEVQTRSPYSRHEEHPGIVNRLGPNPPDSHPSSRARRASTGTGARLFGTTLRMLRRHRDSFGPPKGRVSGISVRGDAAHQKRAAGGIRTPDPRFRRPML